MEIKKNPKFKLENYSKLFLQLGLVLALFIVYVSMEKKTYDRSIKGFESVIFQSEDKEDIPIIPRQEIIKPVLPPPPIPEKILIVEDEKEIEETIIESTETDESEAIEPVLELEEIVEVEEKEEDIEDVPFVVIEDVPVYPGCTGSKKEKRDCFSRKVSQLINKKFNADLAADLGLTRGKKRIFVMFRIDKKGNVVDIQARAPHKSLEKEAIRVVSLLPKMTPGRQRGIPVNVKYSIPITFVVED